MCGYIAIRVSRARIASDCARNINSGRRAERCVRCRLRVPAARPRFCPTRIVRSARTALCADSVFSVISACGRDCYSGVAACPPLDTVFNAVQSPHVELFADSAYCISYPVMPFAAPPYAPDHVRVGSDSASDALMLADGAPHAV